MQVFRPHLRLVDVDSVSVVAEAAVERPVVVQETLKLQRNFFPFSHSLLTTKPKRGCGSSFLKEQFTPTLIQFLQTLFQHHFLKHLQQREDL